MTSYEILQYEDHYIELLELCPCSVKSELHKREGELQQEFKHNIVNKCVAGRTDTEWRVDNRTELLIKKNIFTKKFREENKIMLQERAKTIHICNCGLSIRADNNIKKY